ncbi:MAG: hypothetical protein HYZ50_11955 [Deltaproteobacteria bacterium]|nr:hypothetical protein [Deltaproteobacteria bacterium]
MFVRRLALYLMLAFFPQGLLQRALAADLVALPLGERATVETPDDNMRRDLWEAVLRAVAARGLTAEQASFEQGQVTTTFVALDVNTLADVATLSEADRAVSWVGAEYRYVVSLGDKPDRVRIGATAEIRAWTAEDLAAGAMTKRSLPSNRTLEKAFMQAFGKALGG